METSAAPQSGVEVGLHDRGDGGGQPHWPVDTDVRPLPGWAMVAVAGDQVVRPHGLVLSDGAILEHRRDAGVVLVEPGQLGRTAQIRAAPVRLGPDRDLEPVLSIGPKGDGLAADPSSIGSSGTP